MKKQINPIIYLLLLAVFFLTSQNGRSQEGLKTCDGALRNIGKMLDTMPDGEKDQDSTLFFLPAALKQTAAQRGVSVLTYLTGEIERLRSTKMVDQLLIGPVQQQVIIDYHFGTQAGDNIAYYNVAQFHKPGHISVDSSLGTEMEFRAFLHAARSQGIDVLIDFVAGQIGYLGKNAAEQAHFWRLLQQEGVQLPPPAQMEEMVVRAVREGYHVESDITLQEKFLASHAYFPPFGWKSRTDPEFFYKGQIDPEAYNVFDHADRNSDSSRWAENEIQTKELSGLPKLFLENPKLREYVFSTIEPLTSAGVTGFRIDAARHMKIDILSEMISRMISGVKRNNVNSNPQVICEYWTINLRRITEAMAEIRARIGDDAQYVYFFDHLFPAIYRSITMTDAAPLSEIASYLTMRGESEVDVSHLIPIVIDHDSYRPIWNGSVDSIVKTVTGYALAFFSFQKPPLLYNSFADKKFAPDFNPLDGNFPRHQIDNLLEYNTSVLRSVNSLYQYMGEFDELFKNSLPVVKVANFDELIISRHYNGQTLNLRITRGDTRFRRDNTLGKRTWDFFSENNDRRGLGVEIFLQ